MMLFFKEFKKTVMSVTYFIFVAVLLLFAYTQIGLRFDPVEAPKPGLENYGSKYEEQPDVIMPKAIEALGSEFEANSYDAYPLGLYKNVKLNDEKQAEMAEILAKLMDKNRSYEQFRELMRQADRLIGGGSKYSDTYLIHFGIVPKTYADAQSDYKAIVEQDKITGALARLFSDYLGIVLSLFPVFLAVAMSLKDRRAKCEPLFYTRSISSCRFMMTRYAALVAATFVPVLVLAVYAGIQTSAEYRGLAIDHFAFVKYSFGWLLPSIMVSTAVGVCLTVLTQTPIAIIVQGIWWFIDINNGIRHIDGGYGASLAIRHNNIGQTEVFLDHIPTLLINRISYALFAIALVLFTGYIYELKRRGKLDVVERYKQIFTNRKIKFEA